MSLSGFVGGVYESPVALFLMAEALRNRLSVSLSKPLRPQDMGWLLVVDRLASRREFDVVLRPCYKGDAPTAAALGGHF